MYGSIMLEKLGRDADTLWGFAQSGPFGGANFIADGESQNLSGAADPLQLIVPGSGQGADALQNFSIIASGSLGSAAGDWTFNLCLDAAAPEPATPIGPLNIYGQVPSAWSPATVQANPNFGQPRTPRQPLPQIVAAANITVGSDSAFTFEADITNSNGSLSGNWIFSLAGVQQASGSLSNLPGNFNRSIAAFLQIAAMPNGSSISGVVLAVSVLGYNGRVQTLN